MAFAVWGCWFCVLLFVGAVGLPLVLSLCWLVCRGGFSAGVLVADVGRVGLFVCGLLLVFLSGVAVSVFFFWCLDRWGVCLFLLFAFLCFVAVFLSWFLWFAVFCLWFLCGLFLLLVDYCCFRLPCEWIICWGRCRFICLHMKKGDGLSWWISSDWVISLWVLVVFPL